MFVGRSCFFITTTEKAATTITKFKTKEMKRRTLTKATLFGCTLLVLIAHMGHHNVSAMSIDRLASERNELQQHGQQQEHSQQLKQQQPSLTVNYGNSDDDNDDDDGINSENTNNNDNDLLVDDMQLTAVPAVNGGDNTDMYMLVPASIAAEQSIQKDTVETANRIDQDQVNIETSLASGTGSESLSPSSMSSSADDMLMLESDNTPALMQIVEVPSEITIETDEVPVPQSVIDEDGDAEADTADEDEANEAETLPELVQEAVEQLVNSEEATVPSSSSLAVSATSPDVNEQTDVEDADTEEEENTGYQLPQQLQIDQQQTAEAPAIEYTTTPTTFITEELLVSQAEPLVQQLQEQPPVPQQIKENIANDPIVAETIENNNLEQIFQDDIKENPSSMPQEIENYQKEEENNDNKGGADEVQLENVTAVDEFTTEQAAQQQVDFDKTTENLLLVVAEDLKDVTQTEKQPIDEILTTNTPLISSDDADAETLNQNEQMKNDVKVEGEIKVENEIEPQQQVQFEEKPNEQSAPSESAAGILTETIVQDDNQEVIQSNDTNGQTSSALDGVSQADAEASESVQEQNVVTETIINNHDEEETTEAASLLVLTEIEQKPTQNVEEIVTINDDNLIKPSDLLPDTTDVIESETKSPAPAPAQDSDATVEQEQHKETINNAQVAGTDAFAPAPIDVAEEHEVIHMDATEQGTEQKQETEAQSIVNGGNDENNNNSLLTTIIQVPEQQQQQEKEVIQALEISSSTTSTTVKPSLTNLIDNVLNYVNTSYNQQQSQQEQEQEQKPLKTDTETNDAEAAEFNAQLRRSYDGAQVWRIVVQTDKDKKLADELQTKYDGQLWKEVKQEVDYLLKPQVLAAAERHIRSANLSRIVLIDNLQQVIEVENPPAEQIVELQNRKGHRLSWQAYHRLEDIHGFIDYMAKTYPDICSVETIGYSVEKRPLKILKISNGNSSNPSIWIDGGMHAREWISPATVSFIANQLIEGWEDLPEHMRQINYYLHPVANPDGYEYSHTTDRLWRKNMRSHGRQCPGVDLNRNFGYKWGGKGTSASPCAQTYRGSKAFSEPETFYISKFISGNPRNTFQGYLSFHSYGQFILYPWGYDYHLTQDRGDLDRVARQAGTSITKLTGDKYTVGSSATTLYPAAGGSDDWAKGIAGIKYAYTIEMGDTGRYGFVLPARFIHPNGKVGYTFVETVARAIINERTKTSRKRIF